MANVIAIARIGLAVLLVLREGGKGPVESFTSSGRECFLALGLLLVALLVYLGGLTEGHMDF